MFRMLIIFTLKIIEPHVNIINCMNIQIMIVNIIITRKMTCEKLGWGLKFPTLEPPAFYYPVRLCAGEG